MSERVLACLTLKLKYSEEGLRMTRKDPQQEPESETEKDSENSERLIGLCIGINCEWYVKGLWILYIIKIGRGCGAFAGTMSGPVSEFDCSHRYGPLLPVACQFYCSDRV